MIYKFYIVFIKIYTSKKFSLILKIKKINLEIRS